MKNTLAMIGMFAFGAVLGASATMLYVESKYVKKEYAEKEISVARETYSKLSAELQEEKKKLMDLNELHKSRIMDDYKKGLSSFGYVEEVIGKEKNQHPKETVEIKEPQEEKSYEDIYSNQSEESDPDQNIYLIDSESFGDLGYEIEDITYYSNGVVTDSAGVVIKDPESVLGETVLELLPTYEEGGFGETYVRNDITKIDYCVDLAHTDYFEG